MSYSYASYYNDVKNALSQVVQATTHSQQAELLKQVHQLDERFVSAQAKQGTPIKKVYFTRHAECNAFNKAMGFAPNACVEESALSAIRPAQVITQTFLSHNEQNNRIVLSPMLRPRQTASQIIPKFSGTIEIQWFLTENSDYPSGKPILKASDLQSKDHWFFQVSSYFYTEDNYFKTLRAISKQTNDAIALKSSLVPSIKIPAATTELSEEDKINNINSYIESHAGDLWFIGHGANIATYLKRYLIFKELDYCDTIKVLHFTDRDGMPAELVTPYVLTINQQTGLLQASIRPCEHAPRGHFVHRKREHQTNSPPQELHKNAARPENNPFYFETPEQIAQKQLRMPSQNLLPGHNKWSLFTTNLRHTELTDPKNSKSFFDCSIELQRR